MFIFSSCYIYLFCPSGYIYFFLQLWGSSKTAIVSGTPPPPRHGEMVGRRSLLGYSLLHLQVPANPPCIRASPFSGIDGGSTKLAAVQSIPSTILHRYLPISPPPPNVSPSCRVLASSTDFSSSTNAACQWDCELASPPTITQAARR
jgi:hypothetical protein